jgi:hypothetical protein
MASSTSSAPQLTASYRSSDATHSIVKDLPAMTAVGGKDIDSDSVEKKTAYLSALRTNVVQLQADINTFLTQKMQEDYKAAGGNAQGKTAAADQKEEEMYGEENPEDDG